MDTTRMDGEEDDEDQTAHKPAIKTSNEGVGFAEKKTTLLQSTTEPVLMVQEDTSRVLALRESMSVHHAEGGRW